MPIYPFVILGVLFIGIMVVPPLVAAFIDIRRERQPGKCQAGRSERNG